MNERTRTQPSVGVSMANEILQPTMGCACVRGMEATEKTRVQKDIKTTLRLPNRTSRLLCGILI